MRIIKNKPIEYIISDNSITIIRNDKYSVLTYTYLLDCDVEGDIRRIDDAPIPDQEKIDKINKIILSKIKDLINP
jgi:hypothetical protein